MKKLRVMALALVVIVVSGCASMVKPQLDEQGRPLVYLHSVDFDTSNPDLGLFVPWFRVPADAVAKVAVATFAGSKVATVLEPKKPPRVTLTYTSYEAKNISIAKGPGKILDRPVWEGMPELHPGRWHILARDDVDEYLIPCDSPCRPLSAVAD